MAENAELRGAPPAAARPVVCRIGFEDVHDALLAGLEDFRAAPGYGAALGAAFAAGGLVLVALLIALKASYLAYPLAMGLALVGPFAAAGLYEVSRRREAGLPLSWRNVLAAVFGQGRRELGWMAFVCLFLLVIWMYQVRLLLALFLGLTLPPTLGGFVEVVFTTPQGLTFLAVGHLVGTALALIAFSLTVVSFPLLLDREVDFVTAMITSVQAVVMNPAPMLAWAAVVLFGLIAAAVPFFLGLVVVLPVLGHATWHLYRRLVAPA
jgi:uncharacterized membrane protein